MSYFYRKIWRTLLPIVSVILFTLLLSFFFILYQPTDGPGRLTQRIGWQAWDVVDGGQFENGGGKAAATAESTATTTRPPMSQPTSDVDWWDVEEDKVDPKQGFSLPLDKWTPLLPHDTGLTELAITHCVIPPWLTHFCDPHTTPEEDALKGPWVRVERDIDKTDGLWFLSLYYRRTRRLDVPLITTLSLLPSGEQPASSSDPDSANWHKVPLSIRDGVLRTPALYLWYRLGQTAKEMDDSAKAELITELDVLFGIDRPCWGFQKLETPIYPGVEGHVEPVWLTFRRGIQPAPKARPLHFSREGKFKILQIADLHFSVSPGKCRDTDLTPCRQGDIRTKELVSHILDVEKPDLVIFTGDQLNGQTTSWDSRSVIAKFTGEVIDRQIPWAAIFGNHDDEDDDLSREDQMRMLSMLPYSLAEAGPTDVNGVGNYVLKVHSADPSKTHLLTLYMLDSGAYEKKRLPGLIGWLEKLNYDYIRQSQVDWFLAESASINPIIRPFVPDGAKDLAPINFNRSTSISTSLDTRQASDQRLAKPPALVFFHIPLIETYSMSADKDPRTHEPLIFGSRLDGEGSAKKNGGFFKEGLMKAKNEDGELEVVAVSNGHCHASDDCRRIQGLWMCFGGGGSYSGYGRVGFDRRFRVYEISDYGETVRTYKRTEKDKIVDDMILRGKGAVGT